MQGVNAGEKTGDAMDALRCMGLWAAMLTALATGRAAHAETLLFGRVYDMPGNQLVVAVSTELVDVTVDRSTPVTINGDPANIAELEPGDDVRVTVSRDSERQSVAVEIVARRRIATDPLTLLISGVD